MIRIGIWFKDREWGERVADTILANSNTDIPVKYVKSGNKFYFEFTNITIDIIPTIEGSCGRRFDTIYLQEGIDEDFCRKIIYPTLMYRMFNHSPQIKILTNNDIINFCKKVI